MSLLIWLISKSTYETKEKNYKIIFSTPLSYKLKG